MRMRQTIGLSLALMFASAAAMAEEVDPAPHQPAPSIKAKSPRDATAAPRTGGKRARAAGKTLARSDRRPPGRRVAQLPPPDEYVGALQVVGRREVGSAAWYGGRHVGRRTASGDRLDAVHVTAAHRSLPLLSLVRVTNLRNGRSVIAKITDRGPVSRRLLIDMSPRAAAELDMVGAGIAPVSIEPVALASGPPH